MGSEIHCSARFGKQSSEGKALLEANELIFRGEFRLKIPFAQMKSVKAVNGELRIESPEGRAVRAYSEAGGRILFGTDVGYIQQFDTSEEFLWMSRAGMSFEQILASLTTSPAERFGYSNHSGRIAKGMDADLVVLRADPKQDVTAFSRVRYAIRTGIIIYSAK